MDYEKYYYNFGIRAAELDKCVSRLVAELLKDYMLEEHGYRGSMQQFLSSKPKPQKNLADTLPVTSSLNVKVFVDTNILVYNMLNKLMHSKQSTCFYCLRLTCCKMSNNSK